MAREFPPGPFCFPVQPCGISRPPSTVGSIVGTTLSPEPTRVLLHEEVRAFLRPFAGPDSPVNREAGYIRKVRVLGLVSSNKRRYTAEAAKKAAPLYEGKKVRINHPLKPGESRPVQSIFGWLEGVAPGDDGALYAEKLHYLKAHAMADSVCEAAERNPALFSLSHVAEGAQTLGRDGVSVIESIASVQSVDIVDEGATNKTFFESKQSEGQAVPILLRTWLEERSADRALPLPSRKLIFEMAGALPEDDANVMPDHPPAGVPGRQLLAQAVAALVESGAEGDGPLAQAALRLLQGPAREGDLREAGAGKGPPQYLPAPPELNEEQARDLCALADLQASPLLVQSLVGLTEQAARKVLLSHKSTVRDARRGQGPPVSSAGYGGAPHAGTVPTGRKETLDWLKE